MHSNGLDAGRESHICSVLTDYTLRGHHLACLLHEHNSQFVRPNASRHDMSQLLQLAALTCDTGLLSDSHSLAGKTSMGHYKLSSI